MPYSNRVLIQAGGVLPPYSTGGGGGGFDPSSVSPDLFIDPSNLATLWKDTGGTTSVTADGDLVARADNAGTAGGNYNMASSAARPVYKTSGGLHWLLYDGATDYLENTSFSMDGDNWDMIIGGRVITTSGAGDATPYTNNILFGEYTNAGYWSFGIYDDGAGTVRLQNYGYDSAQRVAEDAYTLNTDFVLAARHIGGTLYTRVNSATEVSAACSTITGGLTGGTLIGANGQANSYCNCRIYGIIGKKGDMGATARDNCRAWMATKAGVAL